MITVVIGLLTLVGSTENTRFGQSDPFHLVGNFIWCGDPGCFDSLFCFDLISGNPNMIAGWRAYEYLSGFRAMAVKEELH